MLLDSFYLEKLYTPTVNEAGEEDESVVNDLYSSIPPAPAGMPGVSSVEEGSPDEIPGVDLPDVAVVNKPTGVDMGGPLSPLKTLCLMMLSLIWN